MEQYQQAALDSLRWFEEMGDYMHLDPLPFAVEAMTRSKRVDFEKLRQRDPEFVARVAEYRAARRESGTSVGWTTDVDHIRVLESEERDAAARGAARAAASSS